MRSIQYLPMVVLVAIASCGCRKLLPPALTRGESGAPRVGAEDRDAPTEPRFLDISLRAQAGRVAVIMYHDVVKDRDKNSVWFDCTADEFKKDVQEIVERGFTVLSLDQLYRHLTAGDSVPAKSVVLTFDDNYQGFYDNALPLLREHRFPAAVFVHTAYVGNTQGSHPKMTWSELKELQQEGLVTIGAHTVTHPEHLGDLPSETQQKELVDSKKTLEEHLGVEIPYMAYPIGSNSALTRELAREAGYRMSFTMKPTPAEGSPSILEVGRYEAKKFSKALDGLTRELEDGAVGVADVPLKNAPINAEVGEYGGTKLVLLRGGSPMSILAEGRKTVGDFVRENNGIAGINGTFFVMAAIKSDDNRLIGPSKPQNSPAFLADSDPYRLSKLVDRPMVLWNASRMVIVPFQPDSMNREDIYRAYLPDFSDAFLAGAWIVHDGVAKTKEQMAPYASQDIMDYRKRAFFGVTRDGEIVCGASRGSITTADLAQAAAGAGAYEAVLLDSGFSTSVVYDGQILVSGHSNIEHASRPVPHAIVLHGEKGSSNLGDLKTIPLSAPTSVTANAAQPDEPRPRRRRHRHR